MATKAASKRLGKEAQMMDKDPPPFCYARPREDNVLEWHFILRGPPDTPYHGGEYWGQLIFPSEYPFKPPGIKMSTPSGRFHTDQKICTSMSDFHPGSWNPAWSVANILVGLLSFMCSDEMTTGGVMASHADRSTLAARSHAFNITQPRFKRIFPDFCDAQAKALPNMGQTKTNAESNNAATSATNDITTIDNTTVKQAAMPTSPTPKTTSAASPGLAQALPRRSLNHATQPVNGNVAPARVQPRSRAIFPILVALAAYLFISRLASGSAGVASPPTA